jgi:hypothetical protein
VGVLDSLVSQAIDWSADPSEPEAHEGPHAGGDGGKGHDSPEHAR